MISCTWEVCLPLREAPQIVQDCISQVSDCFSSQNQNILSWKGPLRNIKSNTRLQTGPPKIQLLYLRVVLWHSGLCLLTWAVHSMPTTLWSSAIPSPLAAPPPDSSVPFPLVSLLVYLTKNNALFT